MPTAVFVRLQLHIDELLREFDLIEVGRSTGAVPSPGRGPNPGLLAEDGAPAPSGAVPSPDLGRVVRGLLGRYADQRQESRLQADQAATSGLERFDVEMTLPDEAAEAVEELVELFDEADRLSRQGRLLTVPAPEAVATLRRWIAGEVVGQIRHGAAATAWTG